MASSLVSDTYNKAKTAMGVQDAKAAQLQPDIQEPTKDSRITTDFGVKQENTDDWLKVVSDKGVGPHLVEDTAGREKVNNPTHFRRILPSILLLTTTLIRSTALTMSVFPSV